MAVSSCVAVHAELDHDIGKCNNGHLGMLLVGDSAQTEVCDLAPKCLVDKHVRALEVPVYCIALMQVGTCSTRMLHKNAIAIQR